VTLKPPMTTVAKLPAVLFRPPVTVAVLLLAVLDWPPLTLATGPLAVLPRPALTLALKPLAVLNWPQQTVAKAPLAVFLKPLTLAASLLMTLNSPRTKPPKAAFVNLCLCRCPRVHDVSLRRCPHARAAVLRRQRDRPPSRTRERLVGYTPQALLFSSSQPAIDFVSGHPTAHVPIIRHFECGSIKFSPLHI
jgi:hypothetical protein